MSKTYTPYPGAAQVATAAASTTLTTAANLVPVPWFGSIVSAITSLGGLIKGPTQHLTYDQANAQAGPLSNTINDAFAKSYSQVSIDTKLAPLVAGILSSYMLTRWSTSSTNSVVIYMRTQAVSVPPGRDHDFARVVWAYLMWVLQGTDLSRPADAQSVIANDFMGIFINAVTSLGWDPSLVLAKNAIPGVPVGATAPGAVPSTTAGTPLGAIQTSLAGLGTNGLLALLVVGILVGVAVKHSGGR